MMDEQIVAAVIRADETKTFTVIEPLYFTCTHVYDSLGSHKNLTQLSLSDYYADRRSKEIKITSACYNRTVIDIDTDCGVLCLLVTVSAAPVPVATTAVAASVSTAAAIAPTAAGAPSTTTARTPKTASAATGTSGFIFGLIDFQFATHELFAVHFFDRGLALTDFGHLDKTKSFGLTRLFVFDETDRRNGTKLTKRLL
jgi:hypothetical protein